MICIYHSRDFDGFCSSAVVRTKYPDAKIIGYDYGEPFPEVPKGHPAIMIDVSIPMEDMDRLGKERGGNLTWIDHHISQIREYEEFKKNNKPNFDVALQDGIAACEVGWKHLFPKLPMPEAVKLLGEYDTWRNQDEDRWNNKIMPFQYGMKAICNSAETFPLFLLDVNHQTQKKIDNAINEIIEKGKTILGYQNKENEKTALSNSFEKDFEGLRAICINSVGLGSTLFDSVYDEDKHDVMIRFHYNGEKWIFSLYTTKDDVDCSKIAKSRGGGGHAKAAGFEMKDINDFLNR